MDSNPSLHVRFGDKKEVLYGYKGKPFPFELKLREALRTRGVNYGFPPASELYVFVRKLPSGQLLVNFG